MTADRMVLVFLAAVLAGAPAHGADAPKQQDYVEELNFYNTDLHLVLKSLAERTGYPFVEDIPVEGKITVHISKKTSIAEVLDQLLRGLNLSWKLDRGVYHISPKKPVKGAPLGRGLVARTHSLDVIAADDAAEAVRPMLSEYGKVTVDQGLNAITVTDVPEVLDSVKTLLESLDLEGKRPAQINIQAKVLQIDRDDTTKTGTTLSWTKRNAFESLASNYRPETLNNTRGWGDLYSQPVNGTWQQLDEYYAYYPDGLTFKVGLWGVDELVSRYWLQEYAKKVNVLSEPDVTVADDTEARILIGTKLSQKLAGGGLRLYDSGVILKVKPKLGEEGRVSLELNPSVTEPSGFFGYFNSTSSVLFLVDILNSREISTKLEVNSGDTVRIGGLLQTENHLREDKVPVLGDLPLLGYLFKWRYYRAFRSEVVILVSPHVVEHIPPRCAATAGISALAANLVVGTTDVFLDWSEDVPFDNIGVVRYHVYRDVRPIVSTANLIPVTREVRGDATSWVDYTLKRRGATYYYAVTALDGAGNEQAVSNSPSVTVPKR